MLNACEAVCYPKASMGKKQAKGTWGACGWKGKYVLLNSVLLQLHVKSTLANVIPLKTANNQISKNIPATNMQNWEETNTTLKYFRYSHFECPIFIQLAPYFHIYAVAKSIR